jgi:transcriptional regulator with XRE-family HTH domain
MTSRSRDRKLGEQIREARISAGLSLRALARDLELSPSYINDIEYDRRIPSENVLMQIADLLDLDADQLLGAAGRVGEDAQRYLKENPTAGVLFRRVASDRLGEDELKLLLEQVKQMKRDEGVGK